MFLSRFIVGMLSVALMLLGVGVVAGQDYPNKVIRIISTGGGSNEKKPRIIAQGITGPLGQPVIVELRGTPIISSETASKAPPDGYTLHVTGSALWLSALMQKVPYDVFRDFSPISLVDRSPTSLAVHPSLPVKSVKELISLAKARPGEINYSSAGPGNTGWFAIELLKSMAAINIMSVPYKTSGTAITGLIGGEVQVSFFDPSVVLPHVKAGRLRALAVSSAMPSVLAPGLPTIAASGVPGYEYSTVTSMFAPAKTPDAIIKRLNQEVVRFLNNPDVKQKFLTTGIDAISSSPEELTATMKSDQAKIGKLIKDAGISTQ